MRYIPDGLRTLLGGSVTGANEISSVRDIATMQFSERGRGQTGPGTERVRLIVSARVDSFVNRWIMPLYRDDVFAFSCFGEIACTPMSARWRLFGWIRGIFGWFVNRGILYFYGENIYLCSQIILYSLAFFKNKKEKASFQFVFNYWNKYRANAGKSFYFYFEYSVYYN